MKQIHQAFTLVELIVVVTILAILATIGFVSYSGYLTGVRDTNRVASLTAISDGLELYRTKNDLPLPDSSVEVQVESETIARQGYAGSNVLQTIEYSKAGKDPKDDQYYSYYLTDDKKHYQMMAFLEESDNLETKLKSLPNPLFRQREGIAQQSKLFSSLTKGEMSEGQRGLLLGIDSTHAATDYSNRHPKVYGKRLGILTDENNTPIQEITTIKNAGNLNMTGGTTQVYTARLRDTETLTGSGKALISLAPEASCRSIKTLKPNSQDGYYEINATGSNSTRVYCDMTTDGGGWTSVVRFNPFIKNAAAWRYPQDEGDFYNKLDYVQDMYYSEFYVNRDQGFDGGEGLFSIINDRIFAQRGVLKGVDITKGSSYNGLKGDLRNWIGFAYAHTSLGFMYNGQEYNYIGHNNLNQAGGNNRFDFPFYTHALLGVIDEPWGGTNYSGDHIVNIFVR